MKILADSSLPLMTDAHLPSACDLTLYDRLQDVPHLLQDNQVLICRANLQVSQSLIEGSQLECVATASSGNDHLDHKALKDRQIQCFDAKGCNADAVADYVVASLAHLSTIEALHGNKAGIIGLGEVGTRVFHRLIALNFEVSCYDPLKAKEDSRFSYAPIEALYECDLILLHANLHHDPVNSSYHFINEEFLKKVKPKTLFLNAARGALVDEKALLAHKHQIQYCTDVYQNEPDIRLNIIKHALLCTPHIAGHSIDAKQRASQMVIEKICQFYHYPIPSFPQNNEAFMIEDTTTMTWQSQILSLYHPIKETHALKTSHTLREDFLSLRKSHMHRRDFKSYDLPERLNLSFWNALLGKK